jgi:hypothetical protein
MKIYNSNGLLIRDYIPFIDDSNQACFKDLVTQTLLRSEEYNYEQISTNIVPGEGRKQFIRQ